eukprot:TRINITY_DN34080_c0_g3_i1.p1 TRINITY_DN34080_c0_g3~~TRINITY_DN34080_c0_g3_i1.p1  ORF type:complete len:412 (+),score=103.02 TRINITY_DN34080_c0_g3_i1:3-1238(+)
MLVLLTILLAFGWPVAKGTLISSKLFAGYQGWFETSCDEGHRWVHWTAGKQPAPGHVTFEIFPDVRDYPASALCTARGLANLGNGSPARLYTARSQEVVDLHVKWAKEYGLDGLGLQRFVNEISHGDTLTARDEITGYMRAASEKYHSEFYIEYDISGSKDFVSVIKNDWTVHNVQSYAKSAAYATDGKGRKFVMLWGCGFRDRPGTPDDWLDILHFFRSKNVAVGVGVPHTWRVGGSHVKAGFNTSLFEQFDLIEPWAVGSIHNDKDIDNDFGEVVPADIAFCKSRGIQYRRVLFPGFAWSNWNGGSRNMIPRRGGQFMWNQAIAAHKVGINGAFVAMFDEFNEGTAILKAAEDKSMIPTNQYFYTLDTDGESLSSDFYLRLTGAIGKLFRGQIRASSAIPIPKRTAELE